MIECKNYNNDCDNATICPCLGYTKTLPIDTVQDLIDVLKKFPPDMEIRDYDFEPIEYVKIKTWKHTNYPYNRPDKDYVCIC